MSFRTKPQSLYIHIPFCTKKCRYCDFFSFSSSDDSFIRRVLSETLNQVNFYSGRYGISSLKTLYIGGGTPTSIKKAEIGTFIENILSIHDSLPEEFTIEINPETVDNNLITLLADLPVTRLSIGIQSFSSRMVELIGRNCSVKSNYKALEMVKKLDK
ncbi:MAG: radical SAM protein, partial [Spirochaetia bacterium]|nr:radical SAM protein [Spirochaetia bacterium]